MTDQDLQNLLNREFSSLRNSLDQRFENIDQRFDKIDKTLRYIRKEVRALNEYRRFFDEQLQKTRRNVARIEEHLKLPPLG